MLGCINNRNQLIKEIHNDRNNQYCSNPFHISPILVDTNVLRRSVETAAISGHSDWNRTHHSPTSVSSQIS